MADWVAIRAEYISTQISTRDLAKKHGVPYSTLRKRAEKEEWAQARKDQERKTAALVAQKTAEAVSTVQAERMAQLMDASRKAADLLMERLDQMAREGNVKPYEVKAITEALKNVRALYQTDGTARDDDPLARYMEEMRNA